MRSARATVAMLLLATAGLACGSEEPPLDTLTQAATATLEDFESCDFTAFPWQRDYWYPCGRPYISSSTSHSGDCSAHLNDCWGIGDEYGGESILEVTLDREAGSVRFWYKIDGYWWYYLRFYIDGDEKDEWDGSTGWTQSPSYPVTAGSHTYKWVYEIDWSSTPNWEEAWIDDITFPPEVCTVGQNGEACSGNGDCCSDYCNNNVCCDGGTCCDQQSDCGDAGCAACTNFSCTHSPSGTDCGTCVDCDGSGNCNQYDATQDGDCPACRECSGAGTCADVTAGQDPKGDCAPAGCQTGDCDGSAQCQNRAAGTDCGTCADCNAGGSCSVYDDSQDGDCPACQVCSGVETCAPAPDGQDPKNDCSSSACAAAGYYHGWVGDTCYQDGGSFGELCNGSGSCRDAASDCDGSAQGAAAMTRSACRTPEGCSGSAAPWLGNVAAGADTYDDCTPQPADTCSEDGECDGSGACRQWPAGTQCAAPTCSADTEHYADTCDGAGTCVEGGSAPCADLTCVPGGGSVPSHLELDDTCLGTQCQNGGTQDCPGYVTCAGSDCPAACSGDGDCTDGYHCDSTCVVDSGLGDPCSGPAECVSGHCVDGFCCNGPCDGICQRCDVTGLRGICASTPADQDPDNDCDGADACLTGSCNGFGQCSAEPQGTVCGACARCNDSGICVFDGSQHGDCAACYKCAGIDSCVPQDPSEDLKNECSPAACAAQGYYYGWDTDTCYLDGGTYGDLCDGSGACRTLAADCVGAVRGAAALARTACRTAVGCAGTTPPSLGYVGAGTDTYDDCDPQPLSTCGLDGECNGSGACRLYSGGTVCVAAHCAGDAAHADDTCDGAGHCIEGGSSECADQTCVPGSGSTAAYLELDDTCGAVVCQPGGTSTCTGYVTCAGNDCPASCGGDADCVSGYNCDGTSQCAPEPDLGEPCGSPAECSTGFCVNGVCCNSNCVGLCLRCDVSNLEGTCSPVPSGQDPDGVCVVDGCHPGYCDGNGQCANLPPGTDCGTCAACDAAGSCNVFDANQGAECGPCRNCQAISVCADQANGQDLRQDCGTTSCESAGYYYGWGSGAERDTCFYDGANYGEACDGAGACRDAADDCRGLLQGAPVDSRPPCHDRSGCNATTGPAFAPVAEGTDPLGDCQQQEDPCGLSGMCDQAGACAYQPGGTSCAPQSCTGGVFTPASTCDGQGTCVAGQSQPCPSGECAGDRCRPTDSDGGQDADGGLPDGGDHGNQPPIAEAGPIQIVSPGTRVELDGSGSRDPEGEQLTFLWNQTSGPEQITLAGDTTARPTFTPKRPGVYVFWLVVSDGTYESAPDFTEIQVESGAGGCGCGGRGGEEVPMLLFLLLAGLLGIRLRRATIM